MTESEGETAVNEPNLISEENNDSGEEMVNGNEEEAAPELIHNICILPPLQNSPSLNKASYEDAIVLPPIQAYEPVGSIRAALSEVKGFAQLTNYRLVLEGISEEESKMVRECVANKNKADTTSLENKVSVETSSKKNLKKSENASKENGVKKKKGTGQSSSEAAMTKPVHPSQVVSPYTLENAVITVPASSLTTENSGSEATPGEIHLNDYGDLTQYMEENLLKSNETAFRVVLERYDVGSIHDHVARFRNMCDGSIPFLNTLNGNIEEEKGPDEAAKGREEDEGKVKNTKDDKKDEGVNGEKDSALPKDEKQLDLDPKELILPSVKMDESLTMTISDLTDFYYHACGEDDQIVSSDEEFKYSEGGSAMDNDVKKHKLEEMKENQITIDKLNRLDELCRIKCNIAISGFNPPPLSRKMVGDLVYLEVTLPDEGIVHVTAIPSGFYINRSITVNKGALLEYSFDPRPAEEPCFSHTLLDCLLLHSKSFRLSWTLASESSLERSDLLSRLSSNVDNPISSLLRASIRQDFKNFNISAKESIDLATLRPCWIVPRRKDGDPPHKFDSVRAEEMLSNNFGLDIRGGVARDWNEELQSAREMPTDSLDERIERARLMHKTLSDFGDASVAGVKAICDGQITPMNPDESSRSHVYLHNNIFFSRAVDAGLDTFKIAQGDGCARKAANRDANAVGMLHRTDIEGLHTLATVLIDYLGTRFVCQSIVPGILQGEKAHSILYGAVEAVSPLAWDAELHKKLEDKLGKNFMIASRKIAKSPLTNERLEYIRSHRIAALPSKEESEENSDELVEYCGPIEMKGIKGSDQRAYCLDLTRLTPRDANWVPKSVGGTGKWEEEYKEYKAKSQRLIPSDINDEEWIVSVLRPELVTLFTREKMREWIKSRQKKEEKDGDQDDQSEEVIGDDLKKYDDSSEYMRSLRVNLNVFLPNVRDMQELDKDSYDLLLKDEEFVREASNYLWDGVLTKMTAAIRENPSSQLPSDGRNLTEFLHRSGVNCRYLGRLATLAKKEEEKDTVVEQVQSKDKNASIERHMMPLCWLEMLECEIVARAAKHVLDRYLNMNGGLAAAQPAFLVASFLSALMCTSEESAADTERRMEKDERDKDHTLSLSTFHLDATTNLTFIPGRREIWNEIEKEIGRRFRYVLHLYNNKDNKLSSRALLMPLLRRVCQRTGVRLYGNNYNVGGKGLCSATESYPISASDIAEIVPLVKHAANGTGEGFVPCSNGAASATSYLHILLPDANAAFEAAQANAHARNLPKALDLIQETTSLYQRVVDSTLHTRISRCLEITAGILFQAQELDLARSNATKALSVAIQIGGFDCAEVIPLRTTLFHILLTSGCVASAVKHIQANMYLLELLAGPRHIDLSTAYQRLGTIYQEIGSYLPSLKLIQEATMRKNPDRVVEGLLRHSAANLLAVMGDFKGAFEAELRASQVFQKVLGSDHEQTKNSSASQKQYYKLAIQQEMKKKEDEKKRQDEEAANAVASEIAANEAAEEKKKKKKKKPKKKK